MAKDLSKLDPTPSSRPFTSDTTPVLERNQAKPAPATQPAQPWLLDDPVGTARNWRLALGRKATDIDLMDEAPGLRNVVLEGAQSWLQSYAGDFDYLLDLRSRLNPRRGLSYRQAAGVLNCMAAEARQKQAQVATPGQPATPARIAVEDEGVYVLPDGTICKVQATRDKARTYAKRLVEIGGTRATEAGSRVNAEYQYEQGLVQRVASEGRKLTLEEAKALTLRYGWCIRCGRHLKAAESVERGMGPVCVTYFS